MPSFTNRKPLQWNLEPDRYLNPWIPPPPWVHLPAGLSHFFGHRPPQQRPAAVTPQSSSMNAVPSAAKPAISRNQSSAQKLKRPQKSSPGNLAVILVAFVGIFGSIMIIALVNRQVALFRDNGAPLIIGSFGAAAVLEFYAIESPLAQPRNALFGQLLASIIGVALRKLFTLGYNPPLFPAPPVSPPTSNTVSSPPETTSSPYDDLTWLVGALSCACVTAVMALTGTVHPPAGATALLAVVDTNLARLGWLLVPAVLLGNALMLAVALLLNNLLRRFPIYWWTPEKVGHRWRHGGREEHERRSSKVKSEPAPAASRPQPPPPRGSAAEKPRLDQLPRPDGETGSQEKDEFQKADQEVSDGRSSSVGAPATTPGVATVPSPPPGSGPNLAQIDLEEQDHFEQEFEEEPQLIIRRGQVILPEGVDLYLRPEERLWLEGLSNRF